MQALFSAVLINALHAAFENRLAVLDRVRADVATGPLKRTVIDRALFDKFLTDADNLTN